MKNLVICCAGDKSLHTNYSNTDKFDTLIIHYGDDEAKATKYKDECTFFARKKGIKFNLVWSVINEGVSGLTKEALFEYDYIFLVDDDILTNADDISEIFNQMQIQGIDLAQGALSKDSYITWQILKQNGEKQRSLNTVEIMMPFFSKRFFAEQYKFWEYLYTGFFLDTYIWNKIISDNQWKCVVFDNIPMKHTRQLGKGDVYQAVKRNGINPFDELQKAFKELGIDGSVYKDRKIYDLNINKKQIMTKPEYKLPRDIHYTSPKAYKKIHGFFDYEEIYQEAVHRAKDGAHFIEVGSFQGKSACYLGECIKESGKDIRVDLIDLWEYDEDNTQELLVNELIAYGEGQTAYPEGFEVKNYPVKKRRCLYKTLNNLKKAGVEEYFNPIQYNSHLAHALYANNTIDFIFIDGDHSYQAALKDIRNFYPKLKRDGLFAGHDYAINIHPGVVRAVDEYCKQYKLNKAWYEDKYFKPFIIYK